MGKTTGITWTDHTFNPWWGCVKVSEGCKNCYAETWSKRMGFDLWGSNKQFRLFGEKHWKEPLLWNKQAALDGKQHKVFSGSMCDIFQDSEYLLGPRRGLFALIEATPYLDWQLLTKRPENILSMIPAQWQYVFPKNIWLGTTAENQATADERIPLLLQTPAAVRFVSAEPLLSRIDLLQYLKGETCEQSIERTSIVSVGQERGMEDRRPGENLEPGRQTNRAQDFFGLSSNPEDDKRYQDNNRGAQANISAFQGDNSSGNNNQPSERNQVRQSSGESGTGDLFRTNDSFYDDSKKQSTGFGPMGRKESLCEANQYSSRGNPTNIRTREHNPSEVREDVRGDISNDISDSARGESREASGENSRLCSTETTRQFNQEQKRPISLVIVGCESGPHARPMDIEWVRKVRNQCLAADVPFFLKQMMIEGKLSHMPRLDNMIWDQFPEAA